MKQLKLNDQERQSRKTAEMHMFERLRRHDLPLGRFGKLEKLGESTTSPFPHAAVAKDVPTRRMALVLDNVVEIVNIWKVYCEPDSKR